MGAAQTAHRSAPPRPLTPWGVLVGRGVRGVLAVVLAVVGLFLAASFLLPVAAGGSSFTVSADDGPSQLDDGSLAFVRPVSRSAIEAGDIVVVRGGTNETWRILVDNFDGTLVAEDPTGEVDVLTGRDVEGLVWLHLRDLGTARDLLTSIPGLVALAVATVVLAAWAWRARSPRATAMPVQAPASPGPSRRRTPAGPSGADRPTVQLQVSLVVLGGVDDYELRFALAEFGGRVVRGLGPSTRLVHLTGSPSVLDAAVARLAEVGHVDGEHRSDVLDLPIPGAGTASEVA